MPDRKAGGGAAVAHQAADQISDRDEDRAEQDRGPEHGGEGIPACRQHRGAGDGKRRRRGAIADDGGEGEDQDMAAEFAEDDLIAADRIAEQQDHGAALHLADDGVMRNQQRDQRQQEDREAGQADDDHVERAGADIAGRRAAEEGQRQRKRGQQQRGRQHPAVAQALP